MLTQWFLLKRMNNIILLGAAGFIGTNLALELSRNQKNRITLIDRNLKELNKVKALCNGKVCIQKFNLDSRSGFEEILEKQDVVYHLLSSNVPTTSNQKISEEINDNVVLTARLLEACVKCSVKRIIFLSSGGTVYGIKNSCPLNEKMETYPITSYGIQKVMNEKLLYLYQYMYGLDYRIVRLSNPFGPFQKPNGVQGIIVNFIYKALRKEDICVYGDGSTVRDYIYIDDATRAIINIANNNTEEKIFNVGSGKGIDINKIVEIIENELKTKLYIKYSSIRTVDVPINFLDISRYENVFGKLIGIPLETGIRKTIEFVRKEYLKEME